MKERPILFSGPMVRAILQGRKTQTRRIIKPIGRRWLGSKQLHEDVLRFELKKDGYWGMAVGEDRRIKFIGHDIDGGHIGCLRCPYGVPGDRLWVREAHAILPESAYRNSDGIEQTINPSDRYEAAVYREGFDRSHSFRWRPSIHMPRWASRITLEIVGVRAQRLALISLNDCKAEGVGPECTPADPREKWRPDRPYFEAFYRLWNSINGPRGFGWEDNPWVWVIEFERVQEALKLAKQACGAPA